jgi:hypothetical protein
MSKPALGRGLGSLLSGGDAVRNGVVSAPGGSNPRPAGSPESGAGGVSLLLRGPERELVLAGTAEASPSVDAEGTGVGSWIPITLFASDAVMIVVATLWAAAGSGSWRWGGIALLLGVGCVQAVVAWRLHGGEARPFNAPLTWLKAAPSGTIAAPARVRVHFVDELPRNRR